MNRINEILRTADSILNVIGQTLGNKFGGLIDALIQQMTSMTIIANKR